MRRCAQGAVCLGLLGLVPLAPVVAGQARGPEVRADRSGADPAGSPFRALLADLNSEALAATTVGSGPGPSAVPTPADFSLSLDADLDLGGFIFKDGYPFIHNDGGVVHRNTAVGLAALDNLSFTYPPAISNTAIGLAALTANTNGRLNTAVGDAALLSNQLGHFNTAFGAAALDANIAGDYNVAVGGNALSASTYSNANTAIGIGAMAPFQFGDFNTAVGPSAGGAWSVGFYNIALGAGAVGAVGDSGVIRIGGSGLQNQTFIEGIRGASGNTAFDEAVCTNSEDQLGPCSDSTARVKDGIETMADISAKVAALRTVTFRYKSELAATDDSPLRYGLIAEEVAEIFPTLVSYDGDGHPRTVRYEMLTPLLLRELQSERARSERQDLELDELRREVADLRRLVKAGADREIRRE